MLANYPVSGTVYFNLHFLGSLDLVCLAFFSFMQIMKLRKINLDKRDKVRHIVIFTLIVISAIVTIYRLAT